MMAQKDLNRGWGNLPAWLTEWHCPKCLKSSPVEKWLEVFLQIGADKLSSRSCPECSWIASQCGETDLMLQEDKKAVKIIADREPKPIKKERVRAEKDNG